eukprot:TRINITY_DN16486_c0_g1_i1.p2 TRINITY_DN16486_c0_g1~~TRINITY_DN16486_c0_g1_i1.p2  ORF type:complete len:284 (-),score=77.08 TRINITY_DN16486_c0_g1_i1:89-940(-)
MGADHEMDDFNLAPADVVYAGEPVPAASAEKNTGCASCCYFSFGWLFLVCCGFGVLGLVSSLWFFAVPPNWGLQYELLPVEYGEPMTVAGVVPGQYYALYQVDLSTIAEDSAAEITQMSLCVRSFGNPNLQAAADVGFVPNVLFDPYANKDFEASFDSESDMLADYQFWEGRTLPACASGNTADLKICNKNQKVWVVVENAGKEDTPAPFEIKLEYHEWDGEAVCFDELSYDTIFIVMIVLFSMLFCSSAICTSVCCSWFCLSGRKEEDEEETYSALPQQPLV